MIEKLQDGDSIFFLVIYALAAISGGMGGCVVWSYYTRHSKRAAALVLAYMIIGIIFGIVAGAVMLVSGKWALHEVILYSMLTGLGGTVAVFGMNWGTGLAFRWKNFEVKFTIRKPYQDRRDSPQFQNRRHNISKEEQGEDDSVD